MTIDFMNLRPIHLIGFVLLLCFALPARPDPLVMELVIGHSGVLMLEEDIATAALGNPDIAQTLVVRPNTLLVNARAPGTTSLTLFGKSGYIYDYRLMVSHDLTLLRNHLKKLDSRILVETDPNGNAIVLTGVAASKAIIDQAEIAAIRFFTASVISLQGKPREVRESVTTAERSSTEAAPPAQQTYASKSTTTTLVARDGDTAFGDTLTDKATVRVINLLMTADAMLAPAQQLQGLLKQVDGRIGVEQVNGVFVLRGKVATPAALSRALAIADRFASSDARPDISVISDQGGVLAGDLTLERNHGIDMVDPRLSVQRANVSGARGSGSQQGGRQGGGGYVAGLEQPLMNSKGNLGQNVSRGGVITAAAGKVMSLLEVDEQPRVEMQMRIVAVDRSKTDELGIDWRLDGTRVTIASKTGGVVDTLPSPRDLANGKAIDPGSANLLGIFFPGSYTIQAFLRAIEDKGAANTLSEPLLTAVSGESSSFLVGGSIPIPIQTLSPGNATSNAVATTNVIYLDYGLKLIVRPTVLENGKIAIVLDQAITEPDYGKQIKLLGEPVPAFIQKTVSTVTEAENGETWAVAGLITEEVSKKLREVPFISRVPVLGALFRSKTDKNSRTELMITVTARRIGGSGTQTTALTSQATPPGAPSTTVARPDGNTSATNANRNQSQPL